MRKVRIVWKQPGVWHGKQYARGDVSYLPEYKAKLLSAGGIVRVLHSQELRAKPTPSPRKRVSKKLAPDVPKKVRPIVQPYQKDISALRGAYSGRSALVMGSGPSLRLLRDRDRLIEWSYGKTTIKIPDTSQQDRARNHITIAVNDAILKVPDADFYITGDPRMMYYKHWLVVKYFSSCKMVMPSFGPPREHYHQDGVDFSRVVIYTRREDAADWKISKNSNVFLGEMNSAIAGVNLAVVLGCSPIYVIGCECRMEEDKKYCWEFSGEPGPGGTISGFKSIWLETEASYGRKYGPGKYGKVFDLKAGKTLGVPAIAKWKRLLRKNPGLPIVDVCESEWNRGRCPNATIEEMLSAG